MALLSDTNAANKCGKTFAFVKLQHESASFQKKEYSPIINVRFPMRNGKVFDFIVSCSVKPYLKPQPQPNQTQPSNQTNNFSVACCLTCHMNSRKMRWCVWCVSPTLVNMSPKKEKLLIRAATCATTRTQNRIKCMCQLLVATSSTQLILSLSSLLLEAGPDHTTHWCSDTFW